MSFVFFFNPGVVGRNGGPLVVGTVAALATMQFAIWSVSAAGLLAVLVFAHYVPETLKKH